MIRKVLKKVTVVEHRTPIPSAPYAVTLFYITFPSCYSQHCPIPCPSPPRPVQMPPVFLVSRSPGDAGTVQGQASCFTTFGTAEVILVNTTTGAVSKVSGNGKKGAWVVLDVCCDLVVAQFAPLNTCPQLVRLLGFVL